MSIALQIAAAFGSVAVLLGLMAAVKYLAATNGLNAEVQRKLVHVGTGIYALLMPWLFPDRWPAYMLIGITLIVMICLRLPSPISRALGSTLHSVDRRSYGDILLAISVGLCLFLAGDRLYLFVLPISVLTLADAAAALAGSTYGTRFFRVEEGQKSIEGSVVFYVMTLLISLVCLLLMTSLPPVNILVISLMVAAFGTLVEAASWRGFDNLFLPVGLLIVLMTCVESDLRELLMLVLLFVATLVAFRVISATLGIGRHAAQVYVTMTFLLFAATSFPHAIAPILVLALHECSKQASPCEDRFPELDIVAALTLVSLGWLVTGGATGWNAILFYGMTASAMGAGFAAIALQSRPWPVRIAGLAVVVAGLCLLRYWVLSGSVGDQNWNGPMWAGFAAALIVTMVPPLLWPERFRRDRVLWVTLLALLVPVLLYLQATKLFGLIS